MAGLGLAWPGHPRLSLLQAAKLDGAAKPRHDDGTRIEPGCDSFILRRTLSAGTLVDLVFTDVNMPCPENGFMLADWVREHHPNIEVILTSGVANKASDLLIDGAILAKPYRYEVVLQRIQTAVH